ncbi:glycosyltransferase [Methylomagnum ishizawai]|uniref:glycosyltransferase n=1 Tax=Methylomagnum ishizawai TaxID=1760988 RepID=UPI001C32039C|nr:glycosyltransferase [Methylomagnum ishizawai]BBL77337.1 hypothetical protein MishRS11D_44350 [Methylomagnum ishizawai]
MESMLPTVAVLVPVHQGGDEFRQCLAGLQCLVPPPDEVIVAVDGADDGSAARAAAMGAKVTHLPARSGPAAARNAAARLARSDILLFLDADVVPTPTVVAQVRAVFHNGPDLAALFGSYDDAPGHPGFLSQYRNLLHHHVHQTAREDAHTFWTACGAVRRGIFTALGGFDAGIDIPAMEDIEFGYRLGAVGHRIRLCKDIQVKHLKRWDVWTLLRTDIFQRAIPWTRLLRRHGALRNDLNLSHAARLSAVLAWVFAGGLGSAALWPWAGLLAGLAAAGLLVLNAPLYRFFWRVRGAWFAARVVPWHWLYFLYASGAFAYVAIVDGADHRHNRVK